MRIFKVLIIYSIFEQTPFFYEIQFAFAVVF